jgi:hypothetical protein
MPKQRECILVYGFAVSVAWKPFFHFNLEDVGSLFQTASVNLQIRTDRPNFLY